MLRKLKSIFCPQSESKIGQFILTNRGLVLRVEKESKKKQIFTASKGSFRLDENNKLFWKPRPDFIDLSENNFEIITQEKAVNVLAEKIKQRLW
jgi:hypothetical protein